MRVISLSMPQPAAPIQFAGRKRDKLVETLFPQGIDNLQFRQQQVPNCQTLAPIHALSTNPAGVKLLASLFKAEKDGSYTITFPGHPDTPVNVHPDELRLTMPKKRVTWKEEDGSKTRESYIPRPLAGDPGVKLLDRAHAKLNKALYPEKYGHIPDDNILAVYANWENYHYHNGQVMRDITGWHVEMVLANPGKSKTITDDFRKKGGSEISINDSFWQENIQAPEYLTAIKARLNKIVKHPERYILTAQSIGKPGQKREALTNLDGKDNVMGHHVYTIEAIYPHHNGMLIVNPHDTQRKTFFLSYDNFFNCFNGLTITKVPKEARTK